jgi:hypothetical protein
MGNANTAETIHEPKQVGEAVQLVITLKNQYPQYVALGPSNTLHVTNQNLESICTLELGFNPTLICILSSSSVILYDSKALFHYHVNSNTLSRLTGIVVGITVTHLDRINSHTLLVAHSQKIEIYNVETNTIVNTLRIPNIIFVAVLDNRQTIAVHQLRENFVGIHDISQGLMGAYPLAIQDKKLFHEVKQIHGSLLCFKKSSTFTVFNIDTNETLLHIDTPVTFQLFSNHLFGSLCGKR